MLTNPLNFETGSFQSLMDIVEYEKTVTVFDAPNCPHDIILGRVHLTKQQQDQLATALEHTQKLFDGNLGHYKHDKIHLEVEDGAVPIHSKAYSVPVKHQHAFLKELRHLESINVLKQCGPTEWASPTFIIPKKDGRVRWISDFLELNKVFKRKVYPLPLIDEVVSRRAGYKFFTKLKPQ
ncbi:unnamed protein product [Cylindrotheca closterium]|uniref:Reverse transcriptase domain-containing protein n=1 Tax=Cylindrotheca closterium TaxID=2856 RepID=A0AAD2GAY6_9STRA|nr:unnamed protein product [Cylindrotheca closterium]